MRKAMEWGAQFEAAVHVEPPTAAVLAEALRLNRWRRDAGEIDDAEERAEHNRVWRLAEETGTTAEIIRLSCPGLERAR